MKSYLSLIVASLFLHLLIACKKDSSPTKDEQLSTIHTLEDSIIVVQNNVVTLQNQSSPDQVELQMFKESHSSITLEKNFDVTQFKDDFDEDYPSINCGDFEDEQCFQSEWAVIHLPQNATVSVVDSSYAGNHSLYLYNPHDST